jgi:hypothetical protein
VCVFVFGWNSGIWGDKGVIVIAKWST